MSTYVPIQAITLSAAASSVTFSGIPQTYTDLILVIQGFNTTNAAAAKIQFNADTGSNYSTTWLEGTSSGASSGRESNQTSTFVYYNGGASTNGISTAIVNINNYTNTVTNKTVVTRFGNIAQTGTYAGLWRNTNAITSLVVNAVTQNFQSNSTFILYGIGSGSPKAFGGNTVSTDGTYWYHTFTSSGSFISAQSLENIDYLVIAGGGGGGGGGQTYASVSGGGAGGYRTSAGTSGGNSTAEAKLSTIPNAIYSVVVGAGGTGAVAYNGVAGVGNNSIFGSVISLGGGGGSSFNIAATSGGSGGGGYHVAVNDTTETPGANGTIGQGFAGGKGLKRGDSSGNGGGGGGAGGVGANRGGSTGGSGGIGLSSSITGSAVTRAGGGGGGGSSGGGSGGTGGGGSGGSGTANGSAGTSNTGGGGGGAGGGPSGGSSNGGNGGSGIVIVRYPV